MQILNKYADLIPKDVMKKCEARQSWNKDSWAVSEEDLLKHATPEMLAVVKKAASKDMDAKVSGSGSVYREFKELERRAISLIQVKKQTGDSFDPSAIEVFDLKTLTTVLKDAISKTSEHRWVFVKVKGYLFTPVYVRKIEYTAPSRHNTEHISIIGVAVIGRTDLSHCEETFNIYDNVFRRKESFSFEDMMKSAEAQAKAENEDDDDDFDGDGGTRVVRSKAKRGTGTKLDVVLAHAGFFLSNQALMSDYVDNYKAYARVADICGEQFVPIDEAVQGMGIEKEEGYYRSWINAETVPLTVDGTRCKLVIDDVDVEEYSSQFSRATGFDMKSAEKLEESGDMWGLKNPVLPTMPVVRTFNLQADSHVFVAANAIEPYVYDDTIWSKLILPEDDMTFIQILLSSTSINISDIVQGKAKGIITICSGGPGLGKTLTAEASSEAFKKPFYSVQCSQLGINPEELEKNLLLVLSRAARWSAILLLDEADVYVRTRSTDIQQNAIVGVFLRVLEYYRGVLFMTTNLGNDIDDAILSRATAHLHYELPELEALPRLWKVLSDQLTVNLEEKDIKELVKHFKQIPGRSIRNLLKLTKYFSVAKKQKPNHETVLKVSKYLNVMKLAEKTKGDK